MAINLLFGCAQIETCSADIDATRRFLVGGLGAGPIEQELARQIARLIPGGDYDVDHLDCGEAVFQINQPAPGMTFNGSKSIHREYLDTVGPCVTNLNFFVDDHVHARHLLTEMGAATHIEGPSSIARALADYGPGNSREDAEKRPFLFMGARALIGFDLEILEPNFLRFTEQVVQFPAFVQPRPMTGDGNLRLERLVVVVEDLESTYDSLQILFTPASRSKPYGVRQGPFGRSFRITLGGMEIEYCQPLSHNGPLAEAMSIFGQGVAAIVFAARDPAALRAKAVHAGAQLSSFAVDHTGLPAESEAIRIESRALCGFDTIVVPTVKHPFR
jgi:hypothetical protein